MFAKILGTTLAGTVFATAAFGGGAVFADSTPAVSTTPAATAPADHTNRVAVDALRDVLNRMVRDGILTDRQRDVVVDAVRKADWDGYSLRRLREILDTVVDNGVITGREADAIVDARSEVGMRRLPVLAIALLLVAGCGGTTPSAASPAASAAPTAAASATPAPRVSLKVNWTALTGANSGLWTAVEAGYFKDESLDVELVNINSSSRSIAALIAKEVQIGFSDGANTVQAVSQGASVKLFQSVTNHLVFSIMATQSVKDLKDLKGKKIGITTIGSSTHTAALQALKLAGLAQSDVTLVPLQEVPNILAALVAGQIDAGSVSPPTNSRAKASGFKELINLATDGPDYPSVAIAATTEYMSANPDVMKRFVKAYSRGVDRFRKDKAFGIASIDKYLKIGDPAILDDTWTQFSRYLELPPYVKGIDAVIVEVAATNAKAASLKPADIFEQTYVKQLDDDGFFKTLGK